MEKEKKEKKPNAFIVKFKENKLYLISFIITMCVFGYLIYYVMKNSDGIISKQSKDQLKIFEKINEAKKANDGYYSHSYTLNKKIDIGTCSVDSYSYIYEVREGVFTKYFSNSCLGVVKLSEESNIIIKDYSFSVDDVTYNKDTSVTGLIESNNSSVNLYFYTNSIVLLSDTDLILISNNKVSYINSDKYKNNGGNLSKRYFESKNADTFNFIVFYNGEDVACYDEVPRAMDGEKLYEVYQIHYSNSLGMFEPPKLLIERTKGEYCINYEKDIEILKQ